MTKHHHPIWSFLRLLLLLGFLLLFSWLNATKFDETEGKMILEVIALFAGIEFAIWKFAKSE